MARGHTEAPDLPEQFRRFAVSMGRDDAPLYRDISEGVAEDAGVLRILDRALAVKTSWRSPNILLAAVHYLLLGGEPSDLAAYYPTVVARRPGGGTVRRDDPYPAFARFCREHREELEHLVATRSTQTNEVGRCSALLPGLATVAHRHPGPVAVVELGASAGLNLLFDHYRYRYHLPPGDGGERTAGDPRSPVLIDATLRQGRLPDLAPPPITYRAGLDLSPVDPTAPDAARWLLACQWPDHLDRFDRLEAAINLARQLPDRPQVQAGDMVDDLPALVDAVPEGTHLCLVHTWVAAYLSPDRQAQLGQAVAGVAAVRPVSWLFAENPYEVPGLPVPPAPGGQGVKAATALVLVEPGPGAPEATRLADMHHHGRWLHWWGRP